ncbi:MAG: hypothetical protein BMS9Abin11_1335 [Gammaproteobacteria bacterium]|nr:MAG: hypothetical protein BMS9Abin11_1335 [Gammaproteobacteria bacterium]
MKWLFGILVLMNITLWMWGSWYHIDPADRLRPDINGEQMRLLSAPNVVKAVRQPGTRPATKKLKEVNIAGRCFRIGPFMSGRNVTRATKRLSRQKIRARKTRKKSRILTFRVYLPQQSSRSAALRLQSRLRSRGFRDTSIISGRGLRNAVSVGVFVNQRNARRRIRKLKKQGFRAKQEVYAAVRRLVWLEFGSNNHTLKELKKTRWGGVTTKVRQMSNCGNR